MNRDYDTGVSDSVTMFVGTEVEHTIMHNKPTLFVVGTNHAAEDVMYECGLNDCNHVYLGANMSFDPLQISEYEALAKELLKHNYWVTLDFEVQHVDVVLDTELVEHDMFIPMVSVRIPYADQLGYHACIKIDDEDFKASNVGVWVHRLRRLMDDKVFTPWSNYTQDKVIK